MIVWALTGIWHGASWNFKDRDIDEILFLFNIQNMVQEKTLSILAPTEG